MLTAQPPRRIRPDLLHRKRFTDENRDVLDIDRELAEEKDATPTQVSLAWLLQKEIGDVPIMGAHTLDHLEDTVAALNIELTAEEIDRLEAPSPVWNRDIGDVSDISFRSSK